MRERRGEKRGGGEKTADGWFRSVISSRLLCILTGSESKKRVAKIVDE